MTFVKKMLFYLFMDSSCGLGTTLESRILVLNFGSPKYLREHRIHMSISQTMKTRKFLETETS